jgi:multidrug efflux pump subunit AcrA (membrane-fusion protein)
VAKTYPQVKNGQFDIDLTFVDAQPAGIRRGQTIQLKLTLGDEAQATLIPNGSFYQDTGGRWVFVVADDDNVAIRRNVTLGRRNSRYIEVLDGLKAAGAGDLPRACEGRGRVAHRESSRRHTPNESMPARSRRPARTTTRQR